MDTQEEDQWVPAPDPYDEFKRLLAEVQQILARDDERRRVERGEDGFDG